jgi:hypothetical protein
MEAETLFKHWESCSFSYAAYLDVFFEDEFRPTLQDKYMRATIVAVCISIISKAERDLEMG